MTLPGYKTFIVAALGVILTGLLAMGYITQEQFNLVGSALGFLGLGFLRAGVSK